VASEPIVHCGQCGKKLDVARNTLEDRKPCPRCGSRRRHYVMTVGPAVEHDDAMKVEPVLSSDDAVPKSLDAVLADERLTGLRPFVRSIAWAELPDNSWMVEVRADNNVAIASGIGDNKDDALLDLAEHLMPPKPT
jgi:hypothetical protein